jgi:hypothetical protein
MTIFAGGINVPISVTALQLGDKHRITTPVNWQKGDDVIVHPGVSNDEASKIFPQFTIHDLPTKKVRDCPSFNQYCHYPMSRVDTRGGLSRSISAPRHSNPKHRDGGVVFRGVAVHLTVFYRIG